MCISKINFVEYEDFAMNTEITFRIYGSKAQKALRSLITELSRLEKKLSRFLPGSEIDRINKSSGNNPVRISHETFEILSVSKKFYEITLGTFNILMGTVADIWNYKNSEYLPEESKINQALNLTNFDDLILNPAKMTVRLRNPGQSIDLGAIGKGYAGNRCMEILRRRKIESAVVNLGGNVCVYGKKPDGSQWRVGIRHPRDETELIGFVEIENRHVVTSGDYERYFNDKEGIRRHHILNPATGYPAESGLISVTVVSENGTEADALATSIFATGRKNCTSLLSYFPGSEAVLVDERLEVYITGGLKGNFKSFDGIKVNII